MSPRWTREDSLAGGLSLLLGAFLMSLTREPTPWVAWTIWIGCVAVFVILRLLLEKERR